ncbi:MAG: PEP/pyruvate-binding domain-containing protein [Acidobacteriota bacterium]|nr:PEP/pyruvate-binding domain-containing protein [Acidobacteriota bacterium]
MRKLTFILLLILLSGAPNSFFGQMSRKPSPAREPRGAMPKKPDSLKHALSAVRTRAEFDSIARTYHQGTPFALPHAMFVIDRKNNNRIYYVNSQRFRFHKDFLLANYLVARGADVFNPIYIDENRRFIVGTIAWQKPVGKFTWELWEGDLATAAHIRLANTVINRTFFQPVSYKPNSTRQDDVSARLGIRRVLQSDIAKNQEYLALNTGKAVGRIHVIEKLDDTVEIGDNEIVVLKELPLSLPPVRGIIVAKPSTPLSHVNILAKGWNVPNVYIKDADKLFKEFHTYWVNLEADLTDYKIKRLVDYEPGKAPEVPKPPDIQIPPANLEVKKIAALGEMRKTDSVIYGSKSANLGEMLNANAEGFIVPDGFTVPFYWYDKFMKDNGFDRIILELIDDNDFVHNPRHRRQKLEELRGQIQNGKFDESLRRQIIEKWRAQLGGKPVFVRSSSNSEDLPNFSGAGLYSSVANVTEEDKLVEAVKKVWASLWKFEAYEARVRNYVSQTDVYMSALIQIAVNMDRGGVMITKDPFDEENENAVYISVVCGHNSPVVDNNGIPEQILFNPKSNAVVLMTFSQRENAFTFDQSSGGLKQTTDKCADKQTKRVLTDAQARSLAKTALNIKRIFGNKAEQDIEYGFIKDQLYVVQARPYIEKK